MYVSTEAIRRTKIQICFYNRNTDIGNTCGSAEQIIASVVYNKYIEQSIIGKIGYLEHVRRRCWYEVLPVGKCSGSVVKQHQYSARIPGSNIVECRIFYNIIIAISIDIMDLTSCTECRVAKIPQSCLRFVGEHTTTVIDQEIIHRCSSCGILTIVDEINILMSITCYITSPYSAKAYRIIGQHRETCRRFIYEAQPVAQ